MLSVPLSLGLLCCLSSGPWSVAAAATKQCTRGPDGNCLLQDSSPAAELVQSLEQLDATQRDRSLARIRRSLKSISGDLSLAMHYSKFARAVGDPKLALKVLLAAAAPLQGVLPPWLSLRLVELFMLAGKSVEALEYSADMIEAFDLVLRKREDIIFPVYSNKFHEDQSVVGLIPVACRRYAEAMLHGSLAGNAPRDRDHGFVRSQAIGACSRWAVQPPRLQTDESRDQGLAQALLQHSLAVMYEMLNDDRASEIFADALASDVSRGNNMELARLQSQGRGYARWIMMGGREDFEVRSDYSMPGGMPGWTATGSTSSPSSIPASSICNIDRRKNLTLAGFMNEYVIPGRPVLLSGLIDAWPARRNWKRKALRRRHGTEHVEVVGSDGIATYQSGLALRGKNGREIPRQVVLLGEYIDLVYESRQQGRRSSNKKFPELPYLFAVDAFENIHSEYDTPTFVEARWEGTDQKVFSFSKEKREARNLFFLGAAGTGTYWHQHTNAFNALVQGRKRWYILPPFVNTWSPHEGVLSEWILSDNARMHEPYMLQCDQYAGEVLYVPSSWGHATTNLEPSVGIAIEAGELTKKPRATSQKRKKRRRKRKAKRA